MMHQLRREIILPVSLEQAWEFFSNPANLSEITPPALDFQILDGANEAMFAGQLIKYRVRPLFRMPTLWVSEITHVLAPHYFIDEQRHGPYRIWHHLHRFRGVPAGVLVEDVVDFMLPFGLLGEAAHRFFVKRQLDKIFDYRSQALRARFGAVH